MSDSPQMSGFEALVAAAQADGRIVGLVLTGSRGRGPYATTDSDWDVRLVAIDESARATYAAQRGDPIESVVLTVDEFERAGEPGTPSEWDRYSYAHAQVVIDKLDGRIAELVAAKGALQTDVARAIAAHALDGYLNAYYRAAKNAKLGLHVASRLDAVESIAPFLTFLFALHERVRPFNKFLRWELEAFPIAGWPADELLSRLERVADGDLTEQRSLFHDTERLARARGHGAVIDGWEPDVAFLRGE